MAATLVILRRRITNLVNSTVRGKMLKASSLSVPLAAPCSLCSIYIKTVCLEFVFVLFAMNWKVSWTCNRLEGGAGPRCRGAGHCVVALWACCLYFVIGIFVS